MADSDFILFFLPTFALAVIFTLLVDLLIQSWQARRERQRADNLVVKYLRGGR